MRYCNMAVAKIIGGFFRRNCGALFSAKNRPPDLSRKVSSAEAIVVLFGISGVPTCIRS